MASPQPPHPPPDHHSGWSAEKDVLAYGVTRLRTTAHVGLQCDQQYEASSHWSLVLSSPALKTYSSHLYRMSLELENENHSRETAWTEFVLSNVFIWQRVLFVGVIRVVPLRFKKTDSQFNNGDVTDPGLMYEHPLHRLLSLTFDWHSFYIFTANEI